MLQRIPSNRYLAFSRPYIDAVEPHVHETAYLLSR